MPTQKEKNRRVQAAEKRITEAQERIKRAEGTLNKAKVDKNKAERDLEWLQGMPVDDEPTQGSFFAEPDDEEDFDG